MSLKNTIDQIIATSNQQPTTELKRPIADTEAFRSIVHSRRSVRSFLPDAVPERVLQDIIDLSLLAPSSSNLQPWEFHWVKDSDKKSQLIEACFSQPAAKTAAELIVIVARVDTWKRNLGEMLRIFDKQDPRPPKGVYSYYNSLVPKALAVGPLQIFSILKWFLFRTGRYFRPTPQEPVWRSDLRVWSHKSTALAAQTLMLSARAHNLDSCPMEGFDSWRVKRLLGLPRGAEISMVIGIGKASSNGIYGERLRFRRDWHVINH